MYLDFAKDIPSIKRISYAASFGVDNWNEYNKYQTNQCQELINLFDAVSVREGSGVDICKKYLKKDAVHLLDPTLLLSADDYRSLFKHKSIPKNEGDILVYVLDMTADKRRLIDTFCQTNNLKAFYIGLENFNRTIPPIETWLAGFDNAKFVITDSFHGSVFSIIFNKPFVSIGNAMRGMSRFSSLTSMFKIEDRIVNATDIVTNISTPDWDRINATIKLWQNKSIKFLEDNLE